MFTVTSLTAAAEFWLDDVRGWGPLALEHGFRILPIEGALRKRVEALGYAMTTVASDRLPGLKQAVPAIDFSGWPMIVHADRTRTSLLSLCEAIESPAQPCRPTITSH